MTNIVKLVHFNNSSETPKSKLLHQWPNKFINIKKAKHIVDILKNKKLYKQQTKLKIKKKKLHLYRLIKSLYCLFFIFEMFINIYTTLLLTYYKI